MIGHKTNAINLPVPSTNKFICRFLHNFLLARAKLLRLRIVFVFSISGCDDIIRQHKAACLRVTALVTCKDLLWIGTSAGVLLTMPLPHISSTTTKLTSVPTVTGIPHGHTGHVRFLTSVEMPFGASDTSHRNSYKVKQDQRNNNKLLVISGGDGYEDFRTSNLSEGAGREDATNHLLLWNI